MDEIYRWQNCAMKNVHDFRKEDCIGLLQNWLLSLMMNDVSFVITISHLDDDDNANGAIEEYSNLDKNTNTNNDREGDFRFYCTSKNEFRVLTRDKCLLQYQIKVIDLDGKPAKKKLCNQGKIESKISQF